MRSLTSLNPNISGTNLPIVIESYQKHLWGRGEATLGFRVHRLKTLGCYSDLAAHACLEQKQR